MHILCPHCRNPIEIVRLDPREEIACPSCGSSFHLETGSTTGPAPPTGQKLGKFELIEVVGQGAFGTVYKARDTELDRVVAVKVPRAGNLAGPQELDRFLREARSAAQLRHPSIVSVHEVGQSDGLPYLVSDFAQGVTLTDLLSARRPGFREAAELVAAVADALHYAHCQGVVHRDVKPSNVMIGEGGRPCVMDFGLAKRDAGEITMTVEGQVLGTPAYMPPEQARGEGHAVDARGDVYSLGVILYQLLTGELPFRGTMRMLLHQVLHDEPRPPRRLNDAIPRDLETITLKAMAKEPPRRYTTAGELADDLRRWLKGESVRARPVGRPERFVRWCWRHPAVAGLTAAVAASLLIGTAVAWVLAIQAMREKDRADREADEAGKNARRADRTADEAQAYLYGARMHLAQAAWEAGEVRRTLVLLELAARPTPSGKDLRGWEWHYLRRLCDPQALTLRGHRGRLWSLVYSPCGRWLAGGDDAGNVQVWDATSGQERRTLRGPAGKVLRLAFSTDGGRLTAVTDLEGVVEVRTWDPNQGRELRARRLEPAPWPTSADCVVLSRGLDRLAIAEEPKGGGPSGVAIWDLTSGRRVDALKPFPRPVTAISFCPDGERVACAAYDETAIWEVATGRKVVALKQRRRSLFWVEFSTDGKRLVTSGVNHDHRAAGNVPAPEATVWDASNGEKIVSLSGHGRAIGRVTFSRCGTWVATAGIDRTIRIWEVSRGQTARVLKGHTDLPSLLAFSPNGKRLASSDVSEPTVRVWDEMEGDASARFTGFGGLLCQAALSPDGQRLAAASTAIAGFKNTAGEVRVWDCRTAQTLFRSTNPTGSFFCVAFSRDGKWLATAGEDRVVQVCDAATGARRRTLNGHTQSIGRLAFSPDGRLLASATRTDAPLARLVRSGQAPEVMLWDLESGRASRLQGHADNVYGLAFRPDGGLLATSSGDGTVRLWDVATGAQRRSILSGGALVCALAFSPDGRLLAGASNSELGGTLPPGEVRIWDPDSGEELRSLRGHSGPVHDVVFTPDGKRLVSAGDDGFVKVWDPHLGQEVLSLRDPVGAVVSVSFSADGRWLASANPGGATLWDGGPLRPEVRDAGIRPPP